MRSFDLLPPAQAMDRLMTALREARAGEARPHESVAVAQARGRVLAQDVVSPMPVPEFRRSTVDGYALKASATPGVMRVIGEVRMGEASTLVVRAGEAALVHTGGNVPEGADAVVMVEQTRALDVLGGKIQTTARLAPDDNLIQIGEDVRAGDVVARAGAVLREQEIAGLLSLGVTRVAVARKPRVALIPSGDELVPPEAQTRPGQVRNTNAPMLAALVERAGGESVVFDVLPDMRAAFERAASEAMTSADMVVFMASSSVGERDFVPDIVNGMGAPGILAHGILFRPGKPTLFALANGKPVFGLPGNPISALVTARLFMLPALRELLGATALDAAARPSIQTTLTRDVKSPKDLEHWFPVKLTPDGAEPISTKSNLIFGLVRADGLVCAPIGVDRVAAGESVSVLPFD
jgi:molybdopterin molybdotransferase